MADPPPRRIAAAQLPDGDVVRILLDQHARIREGFAKVRSDSPAARQRSFAELRRLLAVHEVAEEMVVRPVTRLAADGGRVAHARNDEEDKAARMLADLEGTSPSSTEFATSLAALEAAVLEHADEEEAEEFPLILASRGEQQRAWMGRALRLVEAVGPTHPHPMAAGSTAAQYALGPLVSLVDHTRDVVRKVLSTA